MAGPEEVHQGFGFGRGPILMGLVSLLLMMVAFFIVLVGMSDFDDSRVRSVLVSIQTSFAGMPGGTEGTDEQSRADSIALEAVRNEVAGVFATALQLDRIERTGGTAQLLPGADAVLRRVVAALDRRPAGYRYELDALVGRASVPADASAAADDIAPTAARSGALVRAFIAAGALPSSMAAALQPEAPERIRIVVRLIAGARPSNLFGQAPAPAAQP